MQVFHPIALDGFRAYYVPMHFLAPIWHSFQDLPSDAGAACVSASCIFSLATLEVAFNPGITIFALTERKQPDVWRWEIVDPEGYLLKEGWEPTQEYSKRAAVDALEHEMDGGKIEYSRMDS